MYIYALCLFSFYWIPLAKRPIAVKQPEADINPIDIYTSASDILNHAINRSNARVTGHLPA